MLFDSRLCSTKQHLYEWLYKKLPRIWRERRRLFEKYDIHFFTIVRSYNVWMFEFNNETMREERKKRMRWRSEKIAAFGPLDGISRWVCIVFTLLSRFARFIHDWVWLHHCVLLLLVYPLSRRLVLSSSKEEGRKNSHQNASSFVCNGSFDNDDDDGDMIEREWSLRQMLEETDSIEKNVVVDGEEWNKLNWYILWINTSRFTAVSMAWMPHSCFRLKSGLFCHSNNAKKREIYWKYSHCANDSRFSCCCWCLHERIV